MLTCKVCKKKNFFFSNFYVNNFFFRKTCKYLFVFSTLGMINLLKILVKLLTGNFCRSYGSPNFNWSSQLCYCHFFQWFFFSFRDSKNRLKKKTNVIWYQLCVEEEKFFFRIFRSKSNTHRNGNSNGYCRYSQLTNNQFNNDHPSILSNVIY